MKRLTAFILMLLTLLSSAGCSATSKHTTSFFEYFDTVTTVVGYSESKEVFEQDCEKIKAELARYHKLFDIYHAYEGVDNLYTLNQTGKLQNADPAIIELLSFGMEMYEKSDGKLNIAMGAVLSLWQQSRKEAEKNPDTAKLPSEDALWMASAHCYIEDIIIDEKAGSVMLRDPDMRIDVGAIAKGFVAKKLGEYMRQNGMPYYTVSLGGNVLALQTPNGKGWQVGIENPDKTETETPFIEMLRLENAALVTSGSYQRYFTVGGNTYHHIIDPETLRPANAYLSVSIRGADAAVADALSTALFCMPMEEGKALAKELGAEAMWVFENGDIEKTDSFTK